MARLVIGLRGGSSSSLKTHRGNTSIDGVMLTKYLKRVASVGWRQPSAQVVDIHEFTSRHIPLVSTNLKVLGDLKRER